MSRWRVRSQSVPKRAEPAKHNKDCAGFRRPRRGRLLVAVADGATQAYQAGSWASILTAAWIDGELSSKHSNASLSAAVSRLAERWRAENAPAADAPWYATAKAARGSYSTLLGLEMERKGRAWHWRLLAVGDTVAFVLGRDGRLVASHPLADSGEFGSSPPLLGTGRSNPDLETGRRLRRKGTLEDGGRALIATDALAKCLLEAHESGIPIWAAAVDAARTARTFSRWVAVLREAGQLDDDDTTLMVLERGR